MANGLMYPTGISADPIDITSGAKAFMKSAVEARLGEIASSQERISENQKYVLKALSAKAIPELAREQRDRYTQEIEDYRKKVVDKFKSSSGELTMRDQTEIQDGFVDLEQRQLGELNELKQFQKAQDKIYDPNFKYGYDVEKYSKILADKYKNLMEGKGIGNMSADLAQAQIPASVGDIIDKAYGKDIKALDTYELGAIKGNIFTETQYQGLALENNPDLTPLQKEGVKKAQRVRAEIMQNPNIANRYKLPDGSVDEQKLQQAVTDSMSPVVQKSSIISRARDKSEKEPAYISYEPDKETAKTKEGDVSFTYKASIPLTGVTSFSHDGDRVAVESVNYAPVAKDMGEYNKFMTGRLMESGKSKYGIIDDKYLDEYKGEIEYRPVAKLVVPKEKGLFFRTLDDLAGKDTDVKFVPFEGKVKAAIVGKMGTKQGAYMSAIEEAGKNVGKTKEQPTERKLTKAQEAQLKILMKNNPDYTREELINEVFN